MPYYHARAAELSNVVRDAESRNEVVTVVVPDGDTGDFHVFTRYESGRPMLSVRDVVASGRYGGRS